MLFPSVCQIHLQGLHHIVDILADLVHLGPDIGDPTGIVGDELFHPTFIGQVILFEVPQVIPHGLDGRCAGDDLGLFDPPVGTVDNGCISEIGDVGGSAQFRIQQMGPSSSKISAFSSDSATPTPGDEAFSITIKR